MITVIKSLNNKIRKTRYYPIIDISIWINRNALFIDVFESTIKQSKSDRFLSFTFKNETNWNVMNMNNQREFECCLKYSRWLFQ